MHTTNATRQALSPCCLIVEDDPLYLALYHQSMQHLFPAVARIEARSGYEALDKLSVVTPCMVILDLHMPGFDGFSFLDIVKFKPQFADLPVLIISSDTSAEVARLRQLPNVHVFAKPIKAPLFERIVQELIAAYIPSLLASTGTDATETSLQAQHQHIQRSLGQLFYELAPDRLATLSMHADNRDYFRLKEWCHAMIGTASLLSAHELHEKVQKLADSLATGARDDIEDNVSAVAHALRHTAILLATKAKADDC
jgi:CheY-like chemotaxis protein